MEYLKTIMAKDPVQVRENVSLNKVWDSKSLHPAAEDPLSILHVPAVYLKRSHFGVMPVRA